MKSEARESDEESCTSEPKNQNAGTTTRYGRVMTPATTYEPSTGKTVWVATGDEVSIENTAFQNYYVCLQEIDSAELLQCNEVQNTFMEFQNVGAGVGGAFENTEELKPMKYKEAINWPDGVAWKEEIQNEHQWIVSNNVFEVIERTKMPEGEKP